MPIRRAKIIEERQLELMLKYITGTETQERDRTFIVLSCKAGLRASEIALLTWSNVTNGEGEIIREIRIDSSMGKGGRERTVPMHDEVFKALCALRTLRPNDTRIAYSVKAGYTYMSPNAVVQWFRRYFMKLGFEGMSSHSGRRTFATRACRQCNLVGASLMDVQRMMGHARADTLNSYVEYSDQAKDLVELI
jgi:integrase/recombinase XerD